MYWCNLINIKKVQLIYFISLFYLFYITIINYPINFRLTASADIMSTSPGSGSLTGKALTSMVSSIYENLDNPATPNTPTITVAVPDCTTGGDDTNSRDDNPEPAASGVVGSGSDAVGAGSDPVGEGSGPVGGAVVVNSRPGKKHRKKSHKCQLQHTSLALP